MAVTQIFYPTAEVWYDFLIVPRFGDQAICVFKSTRVNASQVRQLPSREKTGRFSQFLRGDLAECHQDEGDCHTQLEKKHPQLASQ